MTHSSSKLETSDASWPDLPYAAWRATCETLQLWTQVVGKIRMAHTSWLNHSWHVTLYVSTKGLTTSPIYYGGAAFELHFDFVRHELDIAVSNGSAKSIALRPMSVAEFFEAVTIALRELDIAIAINDHPCEIPAAIRFSEDRTHAAYDAGYAQRFWRVLLQVDRVFKSFRTRFIGKCSPVHFFWGSFDLAVTRFSGRHAPVFTGKAPGVADAVMREAYSHEVSSAGFWPGGGAIDYPAFYSYGYPVSPKLRDSVVQPEAAFYNETLGEFILPYDAVRLADDPDATLMAFLQSTYEAVANSADWPRAELECAQGVPGKPRELSGPGVD